MVRRRLVGLVLALAGGLLVSACTQQAAPPAPRPEVPVPHETNTPTPTPLPNRDFTVGTTDVISTVDPAAMTDGGSETIAFTVYQRLMTTPAGSDLLKPDAARDCIFEQATVYTCTLREGLRFHSGKPVTSTEVKYSIDRARTLGVPGSSAAQLASIDTIQTPDEQTVRFVLSYADSDIGYALASPAASIIDPQVFAADAIAEPGTAPAGSGPYRYVTSGEGIWTFARHETYQGYSSANIVRVVLREYPASADLEQAMAAGDVDVAWRGLDQAAVIRQRQAADRDSSPSQEPPPSPFRSVEASGARVIRLQWNPASPQVGDATTRAFVSEAVAGRRTLTSIMPTRITGSQQGLYTAGGRPQLEAPANPPVALVLGYDPRMPDGAEIAWQLERSLDDTGFAEASVQPGIEGADLWIVDTRAPTWTPRAWLQAYTQVADSPHASEVAGILTGGLTSSDAPTREAATRTLQAYAAEDAYVTPLTQSNEYVFVRDGYRVDLGRMGTGWQLGLAAFSRTD